MSPIRKIKEKQFPCCCDEKTMNNKFRTVALSFGGCALVVVGIKSAVHSNKVTTLITDSCSELEIKFNE